MQAVPRDLNVLPEYAGPNAKAPDPRSLDKLFDGVNNTRLDTHMWLSPLTRASGGLASAASPVAALPGIDEDHPSEIEAIGHGFV